MAYAQYTTTSDGSGGVIITGYSGPSGAVAIPSTIGGKNVTGIGTSAFYYQIYVTSVTIPSGVKSIGNVAFAYCQALASVSIPTTVTSIGNEAFEGCTDLTTLTIPSSVTTIGFDPCGDCTTMTTLTVASGNTTYSSVNNALFDKNQLTLIQYPAGLSAASYTIPTTVTSIGIGAFDSCANITSVTMPGGLTSIGTDAFTGCWRLYSATLPSNLTTIGTSAFYGCSSLVNVTIPASVTSLGDAAFMACTSLGYIIVNTGNASYSSDSNGIVYNKNQTTLIVYPSGRAASTYTIPSTVTAIESDAFAFNLDLVTVTISASVTNIGLGAFQDCNSLTSAVFLGNAPTTTGASIFSSDGSNFTVSYYNGATGFTTPYWTDSAGDTFRTTDLTVTLTFSQWEAKYPALTDLAPYDTPLKDGVSTIQKYVFDIDPTRPMTQADRAALPAVSIDTTTIPGTSYLALTYRQNALMTGVTIDVSTSTDLQAWSTGSPTISKQVRTDSVTGDPIIEVGVPTNGEPNFYIRLYVDTP